MSPLYKVHHTTLIPYQNYLTEVEVVRKDF